MNTLYTRRALRSAVLCCGLVLAASHVYAQSVGRPVVIRLQESPSPERAASIAQQGIELLHHYGDNVYLATAPPKGAVLAKAELQQRAATAATLPTEIEDLPAGELEVALRLAYPAAAQQLQRVLDEAGFQPAAEQVQGGIALSGTVDKARLAELLLHPLVVGVNQDLGPLEPLNMEVRTTSGVTALNAGIPGAPDLNGTGIVLGIGDGGQLSGHPDIGDRVLFSTTYYNSGWGNHPDMVAGIMASAGNIDTRHRGIAPEAELIVEPSSGITYRAPDHYANYGMTLTNNSYGPSFSCVIAGNYYASSANMDQQLLDHPMLMHVYAAGNSGRADCDESGTTYGNLVAGPQTAKNTLTVGNLTANRIILDRSSSGPTRDGRLKPELVAVGTNVTSNSRNMAYGTGSGTSYAAPAATAMLGLLAERFNELYPGQEVSGALLKALACNTAEDLGPAGPDYDYGYGLLSGPRALNALEAGHWRYDSLAQGQQKTVDITLPAGMERSSLMLYWADEPGPTSNTGSVLINDLDLVVVTPAGDSIRPWVLDAANPAALATQGRDSLNNIEQVSFAAPASGTYRLVVSGYNLPLGNVPYYLTWSTEAPSVTLTCPYGGESLEPATGNLIAWDASAGQTGTWTLEYRVHDPEAPGVGTWQAMATALPSTQRSYTWATPGEAASYEIRVTNNSSGLQDATGAPVTVLASPRNTVGESLCNGDVSLSWTPQEDAASYEVYRYAGEDMELVATVSDTTSTLDGLDDGSIGYYAVAARSADGARGPRSYALAITSTVEDDCGSPLPVEWIGVETLELSSTEVEVAWTVGSEVDIDFYEVLRGLPLGDSLAWSPVGRVNSQPGGTESSTYRLIDQESGAAELVYYKVRQQDLDGSESYSPTVAHQRTTSSVADVSPVSLLANPVGQILSLQVARTQVSTASLYDAAGRQVHHVSLQPGRNDFAWPAHLGPGFYVLRLQDGARTYAHKLLHR